MMIAKACCFWHLPMIGSSVLTRGTVTRAVGRSKEARFVPSFNQIAVHDRIVRSELILFDQIAPRWFPVINQYARVLIILRADPAQVHSGLL
ncbi:hypothetical protein F511_19426 [Dorcoceras hygrometricum]|uniref:Secreted protein n=1 Tax=Dorcoceras hygrometricum TaxID=472368 RepID=A0A2Z7CLS7_9LAMI|nr:hypothetical protein F511_19426 [Dorcoceras hygrometricum]